MHHRGNPLAAGSKGTFNADLGATFRGRARVRLSNTGCTAITAACTLLANDVAREQVELSDDHDDIRVYPVLRVGLDYQF